MKSRVTLSVLVIAVSVFQFGCTSYSFRGTHSPFPPKTPVVQQYKLNQYSSDIKPSLTPWSIVRFGGTQVSKRDIERTLLAAYPDRFVRAETAIPVDISVRSVESRCNAWGLVPYFLTLGIYPANVIRYQDRCEITVSMDGCRKKGEAKFRSNAWLSVWTPFGKDRTDSPDEYTGTHEGGGGLMIAPHTNSECFERQKNVYISEIAAEVNAVVLKLEQAKVTANPDNSSKE